MKLITESLLKRAQIGKSKGGERLTPAVELANCCDSPAEPPKRRSTRNKADTPMVRLPCVAAITGKTPGKGQSILKPSAEFVDRCLECNGVYPALKVMTIEDGKSKGHNDRRRCHVCNGKTMH